MKKWRCTVCGYVHTGDEPPEKCPVCGADRSLFVLVDEKDGEEIDAAAAEEVEIPEGNADSKWQCSVCGYVHTCTTPPEKCPVCGADRSKFVLLDDQADGEASEAQPQEAATSSGQKNTIEDESGISRLFPEKVLEMSQKITRFHGHPVAVHIPNGVLPISVLFTFLALLFESNSLAVAAKCNFIIIALAMPVVIATGIFDWINKFKGRMTQVFQVKMICAGIVTFLTIILAIWWVAAPDLYKDGLFGNWFFFLLHLVDLAAAGTAGWYGGKLVFHNG